MLDLRRVSGIGLKTAQLLYRDFGIKSLEELRTLAESGGLASVPGLGEKTLTANHEIARRDCWKPADKSDVKSLFRADKRNHKLRSATIPPCEQVPG